VVLIGFARSSKGQTSRNRLAEMYDSRGEKLS